MKSFVKLSSKIINTSSSQDKRKIVYEYVKGNLRNSGSNGDVGMLSRMAKGELRKDDSNYAHKRAALKSLKLHSQQQRNGINLLQFITQKEYSFTSISTIQKFSKNQSFWIK
ncbi:unnamed protein product [Rhizopus microsporus]|nr:hypothetical protein RMCBS344292_02291 [Rhizopus microsporus]